METLAGYFCLEAKKFIVSFPSSTLFSINTSSNASTSNRNDCEYCGTHFKSVPYGTFETNQVNTTGKENVNVFSEDIQGIIYYIDKYLNVYNTEHIIEGKEDPQIVAKAQKKNGIYTIPELGLI